MAMDEIKIDKDIPIPISPIRLFPKMEVGDSIFVPNAHIHRFSFTYYKPKLFVRRTRTENGVKGVRIWRIDDSHTR